MGKMRKKVAIIGGGYTALSCANRLVKKGFDVTIFEKTDSLGGIAKCIECNGTKIEKHYRHIFKSDKYVINLLEELDLINKLKWPETKMAYYSKNGLYAFGTPFTLLKYRPLSFIEKIIFGFSVVKLKLIKDYKKIEKYTAEEWMIKNCGEKIYKKIWEPLLITKFGDNKDKVSMAWLWGKINLRSTSGTLEGERLGYLDGSYDVLTEKLIQELNLNGCKIELNQKVEEVKKDNAEYTIKTTDKIINHFDYVVNTVPYDSAKYILRNVLTDDENRKMDNLKYTSAKTLLIYSKKSLSNFYWTNIGDRDIPFGGIIEHTNMIDKSNYNDNYIIYISNYMYKDDRLFSLNAEELFDEYYPYLSQINKEFKKEDVLKLEVYEELYAQPIITTNYSEKMIGIKLEEDGLYLGTMAQIYPEDRGMNYAIKIGTEIAENIINRNIK